MKALSLFAILFCSNAFAFMDANEVVTCKSASGKTVITLVNLVQSPTGQDDSSAMIIAIKGKRSYDMGGALELYASGPVYTFKAETGEQLEVDATKYSNGEAKWVANGKTINLLCDF